MKPFLFVDFNGTLSSDRYWRSLPEEMFTALQMHFFVQNKNMVNNWMRGRYTSEQMNALAAKKLCVDEQELWELFIHDCETFHVTEGILDDIQSLRKKYQVVLMTSNMDAFDRFVVPSLGLEQYFDVICNSASVGKLKTDDNGELFLRYAGDTIAHSYLADDSQSACVIFAALGGNPLHVDETCNTREHLAKL